MVVPPISTPKCSFLVGKPRKPTILGHPQINLWGSRLGLRVSTLYESSFGTCQAHGLFWGLFQIGVSHLQKWWGFVGKPGKPGKPMSVSQNLRGSFQTRHPGIHTSWVKNGVFWGYVCWGPVIPNSSGGLGCLGSIWVFPKIGVSQNGL